MRQLRSNIIIGLGALLGVLVKWGGLLMDLLDLPEFGKKWDGFWTKIGVDEFGVWLIAVTVILLVIVNVPWRRIQQRIKQPKPQKAPHIAHNDTEIADGPVYWSLTETLSWIAFGESKTAAQWAAICKADGLLIRTKKETQGFDQAEHKLFEALRARELTTKGKKNKSEIYEDIPYNYFLSNVACQILHDVIDVNQKAGSEMYHWDGPKWRGVKLERQAVLKLWPRQK